MPVLLLQTGALHPRRNHQNGVPRQTASGSKIGFKTAKRRIEIELQQLILAIVAVQTVEI